MKQSTAIIVCDHGLGHLRRCLLLAKTREQHGEQVLVFAPIQKVERLQLCSPSFASIKVHDFSTRTSPESVRRSFPEVVEWLYRLPSLDRFDTIICDNLVEILLLRSDSIISAQFFWHHVVKGANKHYSNFCDRLLADCNPTVLGCRLFSMDSVRALAGYEPVDLYKIPELAVAAKSSVTPQRADLLVTGGSTSAVRERMQAIVAEILYQGPKSFNRVHVDPQLLPSAFPSWMLPADFSINMYCHIKCAICRPGLGVITDLLTVGAYIYCVYEDDNKELSFNSNKLYDIGFGLKLDSPRYLELLHSYFE